MVNQLCTCTVRAIDDHRGKTHSIFNLNFKMKNFLPKIVHQVAKKIRRIFKDIKLRDFKFNHRIRDSRKDDRQCLALYHSPLSLCLSLARSAQKQRQQRSGDRLGRWIPKVLSHVTRKLPIHVPVRRYIPRKHPNKRARRLEYLSLAKRNFALWAYVTAIFLQSAVITRPRRLEELCRDNIRCE